MKETSLLSDNAKVYVDNDGNLTANVRDNNSDSVYRDLRSWVPSTANHSYCKA